MALHLDECMHPSTADNPSDSRSTVSAIPTPARSQVQQAIEQLFDSAGLTIPDRRQRPRRAYPYPIHITPVKPDGSLQLEETRIVIGKHISQDGLDFYGQEALPHRRVVASLRGTSGQWHAFLMDLRWCRFGKHGFYENGGRIIQVAESPFDGDSAGLKTA